MPFKNLRACAIMLSGGIDGASKHAVNFEVDSKVSKHVQTCPGRSATAATGTTATATATAATATTATAAAATATTPYLVISSPYCAHFVAGGFFVRKRGAS